MQENTETPRLQKPPPDLSQSDADRKLTCQYPRNIVYKKKISDSGTSDFQPADSLFRGLESWFVHQAKDLGLSDYLVGAARSTGFE
jgi:hypothetical protein